MLGIEFRDLMTLWDRQQLLSEIDDLKNRIRNIIGSGQFIMFVKKKTDDDVFGTDEDGRIMFSKMKNPGAEEELPDGWEKEGNFSCTNLSQLVNGNVSKTIFGHKDMPELEIIENPDDLIELLIGAMSKESPRNKSLVIQTPKPSNKPDKKVIKEK